MHDIYVFVRSKHAHGEFYPRENKKKTWEEEEEE
jgi:hypothetical protein